MPTSPIEAEATGQEFITAEFGGREWTIPLDIDSWPVDLVATTVTITDGGLTVNYRGISDVLRVVLGDQWQTFQAFTPRRGDLLPASQAFAAAVGVPTSDRTDIAFGAIPRLLRELEQWPHAVEATLHRLGYDYRDRFLFTAGRRRLTLRQVAVALFYEAPYDSPIAVARNGGRRPLSDSAAAVLDLFEVLTRTPHPTRVPAESDRAARADATDTADKHAAAVADYKRRHNQAAATPAAARRRTALETARENAQQRKAAHAR